MRNAPLALLVALCAAIAGSPAVATGSSHPACPAGTQRLVSVEPPGSGPVTVTAPSPGGWSWTSMRPVVVVYVKAGRTHEAINYDPAETAGVASHSTGKDVSHLDFCLGEEEPPPPPPCEPGEPCWCDEHPDDPDCDTTPEEQCPTDLAFVPTTFGFGFTTDLSAPEGAGCSNPDTFTGRPGDQVRFDVCLDGYAQAGFVVSPDLPYHYSRVVTVGQSSEVVVGQEQVVVAGSEDAACIRSAYFAWAGSVAADTGTDLCLPTEPCWCETVPDDPRCRPACDAYARMRVGVFPGHDAEWCFMELGDEDLVVPVVPGSPYTICWSATGDVASAQYGASRFDSLPLRDYAYVWIDGPVAGWLAAFDEGSTCTSYDRVRIEFLTEPPAVCVPWLP